jgi:hypothetical protein
MRNWLRANGVMHCARRLRSTRGGTSLPCGVRYAAASEPTNRHEATVLGAQPK